MRAILVDPKLHRVIDIELTADENRMGADMRRLIGAGDLDHQRISDMGDYLWLDGHGLLAPTCFAFKIRAAGPFAGTGIIIGTGPGGYSAPPYVRIEMIQNDVTWLDEIEPELHYEHGEIEMPNGTKMAHVRSFVTYKRVR